MKQKLSTLFMKFLDSQQASETKIIICTVFTVLLANSSVGHSFLHLRHVELGFDWIVLHLQFDLEHWMNDGLMALFFLLIGLEIRWEFYMGELSDSNVSDLHGIRWYGDCPEFQTGSLAELPGGWFHWLFDPERVANNVAYRADC